MNKNLNSLGVIIIFCVVAYIIYFQIKHKNTVNYKTSTLEIRTIEKKVVVPGVIQASRQFEVKSIISGVIEDLYVNIGDKVKKGDPLVKVRMISEPVQYQKLLKRKEAALQLSENSRKNYDRYLYLYNNKVVSTSEFEEIRKQYKIYQADLESIKIELTLLSDIIRATSDGTILELPVKLGGSVMARGNFSEGTTIAILANLDLLRFHGNISENDVGFLTTGMPIKLDIVALKERQVYAVLNVISPSGKIVNGITQFEIEAKITSRAILKYNIRDGYAANAEIILSKAVKAKAINEKYLQFSNDSTFVEILQSDNIVKKKLVKIGVSDGIYSQILSGLQLREKIIEPNLRETKEKE